MARSTLETPTALLATLYGKMPRCLRTGGSLLGAHRLHVTDGTQYFPTTGRRGFAFWKRRSKTWALRDKRAPQQTWLQKLPHASLVHLAQHFYDVQLRCSHFTTCTNIPLRIHAILRLQFWEDSRVCCIKTFWSRPPVPCTLHSTVRHDIFHTVSGVAHLPSATRQEKNWALARCEQRARHRSMVASVERGCHATSQRVSK